MSDNEIIEGLLKSDPKICRDLVKRLAPPIYKFVLNNHGNKPDAQDLLQETFIKVLIKIRDGKYNCERKFETWFWTIARSTWINHLKEKNEQFK